MINKTSDIPEQLFHIDIRKHQILLSLLYIYTLILRGCGTRYVNTATDGSDIFLCD